MLLDTHTLIWWLLGADELSERAVRTIETSDSVVWVSAASAWEIATKHRIGKLAEATDIATGLIGHIRTAGLEMMYITFEDANDGGRLPGPHRDPFDRLLIAQAKRRGLPVVTTDRVFQDYGVPVIW